ncbi:MAG TPA: aminotransferase class I/II-fold pyridoxal phosphate-dependent enzyme [Actinomycetota bacterium]|nr:aminotransferase class I/II-fold pyridoxal phosphate-dependent enzyme [Actinomycetota bacterium]
MRDRGREEPLPPERLAGFSTRAIHEGDLAQSGIAEQPVAPPVWLTADYVYESLEHYTDVINERRPGFVYGRYGNPTHVALHNVLASLDAAEAAWSFASGMAAVHTAITTFAEKGDHVLAQQTLYGGTYGFLTKMAPRYGIEASFVEAEVDALASAIRPTTRLVVIEPLANPTFAVADVKGIAAVCAERGVPLLVDNTVATPYLLRPLELEGVSLVLHSTTKYIGGHSSLIGGSVAGNRAVIERIRHAAIEQGTTAGAFEAWLALMGVQTLGLRVERQCDNALTIARFLHDQPNVVDVGYSGLPEHRHHERARALFTGGRFGPMLSFTLAGGYEAAERMCDSLRLVRVGSSFGSLHSMVAQPATTSHRQFSKEDRAAAGITDGLIRFAVGGEDPDDLVADLAHALEKV